MDLIQLLMQKDYQPEQVRLSVLLVASQVKLELELRLIEEERQQRTIADTVVIVASSSSAAASGKPVGWQHIITDITTADTFVVDPYFVHVLASTTTAVHLLLLGSRSRCTGVDLAVEICSFN